MVTWLNSARLALRSPSGAQNEAPDGPGAFQALRDDVDQYLSVGGAEYCANRAAITAIPSNRRFLGKLAYAADSGITFRYVGAGNLPIQFLAGQNMSPGWAAWHKPPTPWTPAWSNVGFSNPSSNLGVYGISAGLLWFDAMIVASTAPTPSSSAEATLASPLQMCGQMGEGSGTYTGGGGNSAANNQTDLYAYPVGTIGGATTVLRIRVRVASAVGASVKQNPFLGAYISAPAAADWMNVHFRGVCADGA